MRIEHVEVWLFLNVLRSMLAIWAAHANSDSFIALTIIGSVLLLSYLWAIRSEARIKPKRFMQFSALATTAFIALCALGNQKAWIPLVVDIFSSIIMFDTGRETVELITNLLIAILSVAGT
jgi:hypothetical protein